MTSDHPLDTPRPEAVLASRYALQWSESAGAPPDVFAFLNARPAATAAERLAVLLVDQRLRWEAGKGIPVEDYVAIEAEVGRDAGMLSALVLGELSVRRGRGEEIDLHRFAARFPGLQESLLGEGCAGDVVRLAETRDHFPASMQAREDNPGQTLAVRPPAEGTRSSTQLDGTRTADANDPHGRIGQGSAALGFSMDLDPETRYDEDWLSGGPASDLSRSIRFEVHQPPLGKGGMGIVYQAFDRERGELVALKTMKRIEPIALYRFKNEFRTLADISHPNLVNLYELIAVGDLWFFTMELVRGVDFIRYVQGAEPEPEGASAGNAFRPDQAVRLRNALRQLASGLIALHDAGKLHRDVKPTNVLVTREGRVVLLDFGVSADLRLNLSQTPGEDRVAGTVGYMAPEMAAGQPLTPASDWYSVGVMLYFTLTDRLPFEEKTGETESHSRASLPPRPHAVREGVPRDLSDLCDALLDSDPQRRPDGRTLLARLGGETSPECATLRSSIDFQGNGASWTLVGREPHRRVLDGAFETIRRGYSVLLLVSGRSGSGKSMLIQAFLADLVRNEDAVVLAGRCYERESVPYKALDSVVDALSRFLKDLPKDVAAGFLPEDLSPLARMFPVLRTVKAVAAASSSVSETLDARELRRRAVMALRELIRRIGRSRPLVVAIDDLQWCDLGNAPLLQELIAPPDPPRLLLILSYRSEDLDGSPLIPALRGDFPATLNGTGEGSPVVRELSLGPLTYAESRNFALELLGSRDPRALAHAHIVAKESGGNPYFITELVRSIAGGILPATPSLPAGHLALDTVIWERVARLSEGAQTLLKVVAVSGRPICLRDACEVAGLSEGGRAAAATLRAARLIRGTAGTNRDEIEIYHEWVRETANARLDADELRSFHRRLAKVLEGSDQVDAETIGFHFQAAGLHARAAEHFARGAENANQVLAFGYASKLYALALQLRADLPEADNQALRISLGDALANAGRGQEAALVYLRASETAEPALSLDLKRKAASQFLLGGHFEEGFALIETGLQTRGMKLPRSPAAALRSLVRRRAWLRLRGLNFRPRLASEVPAETRSLIDLCWSAGAGLSNIDPVRGADFQTRGLLLALNAGEPYRIARSLTLEAATISMAGAEARKRATAVLDRAESLSRDATDPHLEGLVTLGRGITALMTGAWREADGWFSTAEPILRGRCSGVCWELDTLQNLKLWARIHLGDLNEVRRVWPGLMKEARERGDLHAMTNLSTYASTLLRLADDQPDRAHVELDEAMSRWSGRGFHLQHSAAVRARALIHLYRGDGEAAHREMQKSWPLYRDSLLPRIQMIRVQHLRLRAQCALVAAWNTNDSSRYVADAERLGQALARENVAWAQAHARLILAGVGAFVGGRFAIARNFSNCVADHEQNEMGLFAAASLRRVGECLGNLEGRADLEKADALMRSQGVKDPVKFARCFAPPCPFGEETTPSEKNHLRRSEPVRH